MSAEPPAFPRALDDDDDDVAWALQTAAVQWERGGAADAIVWLKRAAEAAAESGEFSRSADIQRRANELDRWLRVKPAFKIQEDDGDDGVDELLATDAPEIEAVAAEPTASLVDVLEAEARGELDTDPLLRNEAPVQDLGDLQDVEDIEAVDLDDFEERELDSYEPLEEITQARSSVSQAPEPVSRPPASRRPASSRAPTSSRAPASSRQPGSSRGSAGSRTAAARSSKPASARPKQRSDAPRESAHLIKPSTRPEPPEYKLPPPPQPRLPLPLPKPSTAPPSIRQPFPSEPNTHPRAASAPIDDDPTATPLAVPSRLRPPAESVPEVSATELDVPEAPSLEPPPLPSVEPPTIGPAARVSVEPPTLGPPARPSVQPSVRSSSFAPRAPTVAPPVSSAAPAELDAAVNALSETPPPPGVAPSLDVAFLAACRGLEGLPPETQQGLAAIAAVETLAAEQEVNGFGLALVTNGSVLVMPTIAEGVCGRATKGEPVFSRGTLSEGVSLRVVAEAEGAEVAVWMPEDIEQVLVTCPWVADELRAVADRFQALAGAAMGPLGERLDDSMRAMLTDRCELLVMMAGDVLLEEGKPLSGLYVVGGGLLEMVRGGAVVQTLGPGDLPFASGVLTHEKTSASVRAGAGGALVLHADRMTTHELMVVLPPLLELLSMS